MKSFRVQVGEEVFNSVTHGLAALAVLIALVVSSFKNPSSLAVLIYFGILFLLYLTSTLFHSLVFTRAKKVFNILDRNLIYIFIAATYSILLIQFADKSRLIVILLILIWLISVAGIVLESVFFNRLKHLSTILYLTLGWLGICFMTLLNQVLTKEVINLLLIGGLLYTLGLVFYYLKKLPFNHGLWHLMVVLASWCHFLAIIHL